MSRIAKNSIKFNSDTSCNFDNGIFTKAFKYYWNWASAPVDTIWRYTGLPRTYGITLSRNF